MLSKSGRVRVTQISCENKALALSNGEHGHLVFTVPSLYILCPDSMCPTCSAASRRSMDAYELRHAPSAEGTCWATAAASTRSRYICDEGDADT